MFNEYSTELQHHGILGQRWGVRRFQNKDGSVTAAGAKRYQTGEAKSVKAGAHRALAKVYGINENFYSKHTKNKALASMNKSAKNDQLKKAEAAQNAANKKKIDKLEAYRTKLADKNLKKSGKSAENAKRYQAELDDLKAKGINSETYKKRFREDPDHRAVSTVYNPETKNFERRYDNDKAIKAFTDSLFPTSKIKEYTETAERNKTRYAQDAKNFMNKHNDLMKVKINAGMSKRDIRKASKNTNKAEARAEQKRRVDDMNRLLYGTEGKK